MKIGTLELQDGLDHEEEMEIKIGYCDDYSYEYIKKDDAINIIKHLQTYFKIPV